jgi:hypothetical protein
MFTIGNPVPDYGWEYAIQCAIIAVDEILEVVSAFAYSGTTFDDFETGKMSFWSDGNSPELYWLQVREELTTLKGKYLTSRFSRDVTP